MHQSLSLDVSAKGSQMPCCGDDADIHMTGQDRLVRATSVNLCPILVFFSRKKQFA